MSPLPDEPTKSGEYQEHRGWFSRGYHPHFDGAEIVQSVTFRLNDSVPDELVERWRAQLKLDSKIASESMALSKLRQRIDRYEDAGHGECWLRDPDLASIVENSLLHGDGKRYRLIEWCVMPNHVHVLVETTNGDSLGSVVRSWKSFTARECNRALDRSGAFWMRDYFDRFIRTDEHLAVVRRYIRRNPVKARLCKVEADWRFSSAWRHSGKQPS